MSDDVARNVPWDLRILGVGAWETVHTIGSFSGRPVTIAGHGPKAHGKRVEIFGEDLGGPLGGAAIRPDGTWETGTVPILPGKHKLFARSIGTDGKNLSGPSKSVPVEVPPE